MHLIREVQILQKKNKFFITSISEFAIIGYSYVYLSLNTELS